MKKGIIFSEGLMLLSNLLSSSAVEYRFAESRAVSGIEINDIFLDSRQVVKNGLFIAIEGVHTDSHAFLHDAEKNGAAAAIISQSAVYDRRIEPEKFGIPLICVDDCREAMARIFAAWYSHPERSMTFVGVTGTNGKTTVSRMIFETPRLPI